MRTLRRAVSGVVAGVLAVTLVATGCSSDSKKDAAPTSAPASIKPPDDSGKPLFTKAVDALNAASSFHAVGEGQSGAPLKFDMQFSNAGTAASLTLGDPVSVVSDGTNVYLKASADFWKDNLPSGTANPDAKAAVLASKWVKVDTTQQQFASYDIFKSKTNFVQRLANPAVHWALGGEKTVNGVNTKEIKGSDGTNWYVEPTGAGRVLYTTSAGAAGQQPVGSFTIDQYGAAFTPQLPSANDVNDYNIVVSS